MAPPVTMAPSGKIRGRGTALGRFNRSPTGSSVSTSAKDSSQTNSRQVSTAASSITLAPRDASPKMLKNRDEALAALEGKKPDPRRQSERAKLGQPASYNVNQLSRSTSQRTLAPGQHQATSSRNISGKTLVDDEESADRVRHAANKKWLEDEMNILDMDWEFAPVMSSTTVNHLKKRKRESLISGAKRLGKGVTHITSALGKRMREVVEEEITERQIKRQSRRLSNLSLAAERKEAKDVEIDTPAVKAELQGDKKKHRLSGLHSHFRKSSTNLMAKVEVPQPEIKVAPQRTHLSQFRPRTRKFLRQGLYAGQDANFNARWTDAKNATNKHSGKKGIWPIPMYASKARMEGPPRDFELPFDIFSPLDPEDYRKKPKKHRELDHNVFIGDARKLWKDEVYDEVAYCTCTEQSGCRPETCQNIHMAYECDDSNCRLGRDKCGNRQWQDLYDRLHPRAQSPALPREDGKEFCNPAPRLFNIGVEVCDYTREGKGHGLRACRSFAPGQIILEYTGEIITPECSDDRAANRYKDAKCFYLMDFHHGFIIDATRGSIARFVNHSCEPNCEIQKWFVAGKPRMALFAGEEGVCSGEELTYDYNFEAYGTEIACMCGTAQCRGTMGAKKNKVKKSSDVVEEEGAGNRKRRSSGVKPAQRRRSALSLTSNPNSGEQKPKRRQSLGKLLGAAKTENKPRRRLSKPQLLPAAVQPTSTLNAKKRISRLEDDILASAARQESLGEMYRELVDEQVEAEVKEARRRSVRRVSGEEASEPRIAARRVEKVRDQPVAHPSPSKPLSSAPVRIAKQSARRRSGEAAGRSPGGGVGKGKVVATGRPNTSGSVRTVRSVRSAGGKVRTVRGGRGGLERSIRVVG